MLEKNRGSLFGALVGDSYGLPFEQEAILDAGTRLVLRQYFDKLEGPFFQAPRKPYSDDTAMTLSVARTLIDKRTIDQKDLAINFVKEYLKNPRRGYSKSIGELFLKIRQTNAEEPTKPANEQFNGTGSFGNGAAMRVAPVPLFCHNKTSEKVIELTIQQSHITHTHKLGVNGAILQALAIHHLLMQSPASSKGNLTNGSNDFDPEKYIKDLEEKMAAVETAADAFGFESERPYQKQLKQVLRLIKADEPTDEEVVNVLGTNATALYSVPTAIYCFLKGQNPIKGIETNNPFRRSMEYAIGLGGDTDTIASMTGALSGAYYGDSVIAENLLKHCEGYEEMETITQKLYEASQVTE